MSPWQPLPWQQELWQRLAALASGERLTHALLLAGPRGVGKGHFARGLAMFLLCEGAGAKPCGQCRGCIQVEAQVHPNLQRLAPAEDKREIAIDAVRELIERLQLSSHYGKPKLAIVDPADALNASGINALLKTVEEPPASTYLFFVSERWRALPATLRSRCQILRFAPPPPEAALRWLEARHPEADAGALKNWTRMPLLAAQALDREAVQARERWAQALTEVAEGRLQALKLAERIKRDEAQAGLEQWLALATTWLRSLLAPGRAPAPPPRVTSEAVQRLLADVLEGMQGLARNGNPAMIVESIMIRFAQHT